MVKSKTTSKNTKDKESNVKISWTSIASQNANPKITTDLFQIVGSVIGLTGIITAVFWLSGYSYISGIFSSGGFILTTSNLSPEDFISTGFPFFFVLLINSIVIFMVVLAAAALVNSVHIRLQSLTKYSEIVKFIFLLSAILWIYLGVQLALSQKLIYIQGFVNILEVLPYFFIGVAGEILVASSPKSHQILSPLARIFYITIITTQG